MKLSIDQENKEDNYGSGTSTTVLARNANFFYWMLSKVKKRCCIPTVTSYPLDNFSNNLGQVVPTIFQLFNQVSIAHDVIYCDLKGKMIVFTSALNDSWFDYIDVDKSIESIPHDTIIMFEHDKCIHHIAQNMTSMKHLLPIMIDNW